MLSQSRPVGREKPVYYLHLNIHLIFYHTAFWLVVAAGDFTFSISFTMQMSILQNKVMTRDYFMISISTSRRLLILDRSDQSNSLLSFFSYPLYNIISQAILNADSTTIDLKISNWATAARAAPGSFNHFLC